MIFENSNETVYVLLFISLGFVVIGVYFLTKKKDKNIITKSKKGKVNLGITEIIGSSYKKKNDDKTIENKIELFENNEVDDLFDVKKIENNTEVEKLEHINEIDDDAVEYIFSDEDDVDDEIYDDEIDINDIVLKIDNIGNELKNIAEQEGSEVGNILDIENMIFGDDNDKMESFDEVEKILENEVDAFIMELSNKNEDIRKYIKLNGGKNYLKEYNNRIKY